MIAILWVKVLIFQGAKPIFNVGSLSIKDITFEQAWKASGLSSNMDDYFKEEDAKFVAMK